MPCIDILEALSIAESAATRLQQPHAIYSQNGVLYVVPLQERDSSELEVVNP